MFLRAMFKHDFGYRALRVSGEGEKALVYVSTKPPSQALTRSINRLPELEPASDIDLQSCLSILITEEYEKVFFSKYKS